MVDFELFSKQQVKVQKPDPTKPVFLTFTHHLALPQHITVAPPTSSIILAEMTGPIDDIDGEKKSISGIASAIVSTTYPRLPHHLHREGTPICDFYHFEAYSDHIIVALADGCNWGLKSWLAARNAITAFVRYVRENISSAVNTQKVGLVLLHALEEAHRNVIANSHEIWNVGQTTILGGVVLPVVEGTTTTSDRVFISLTLGDCKSFYFSSLSQDFEDLSLLFRNDILSTMDPGGRIGPYHPDGSPDLRNLSLSYTICNENDVLVLCTDGVHDNLDPQTLGIPPESGGDWDHKGERSELMVTSAKARFSQQWLKKNILKCNQSPTPHEISTTLTEHSLTATKKGRDYMEVSSARLKSDYTEYPGKMDHATCVAFYPRFPTERLGVNMSGGKSSSTSSSSLLDVCTRSEGSLWKAQTVK
jgi:serine/threonine protein phosphatase PrpC